MAVALLQASEEPLLHGGAVAFLMHILASSCYSGFGPYEGQKDGS